MQQVYNVVSSLEGIRCQINKAKGAKNEVLVSGKVVQPIYVTVVTMGFYTKVR